MNFYLILTATFLATSFMTAFSYLISFINKSQFKEPELLNILISRSKIFPVEVSKKSLLSWPLHYFVGFIFVISFHIFWKTTSFEPNILTGAGLGIIAGIIGILGWRSFFYLHHDPPKIELSKFYIQLFMAHIIFGSVAGIIFSSWL